MTTNSTIIPSGIPEVIHVNLNPTMGAIFIGAILSSIFYGITTLQTIIYFGTYDGDKLFLKSMVAALWVLDSASLALFASGVYEYLVINFSDLLAIQEQEWSISSEPMITGVIALIVHLFLAYRIRNLNRAPLWSYVALAVSFASLFPLAIAIVTTWRINTGGRNLSGVGELRWMAIAGDVSTSAIDIFIAATLSYQLYHGRTALKPTQKAINILSIYIVSSGVLTAGINFATLISYLSASNKLIFQLFNACSSKAYVNTLMATLNMRQAVRRQVHPTVIGLSDSHFGSVAFGHNPEIGGTSETPVTIPMPSGGEYDLPLSNLRDRSENLKGPHSVG